jgi:hypothetical protein
MQLSLFRAADAAATDAVKMTANPEKKAGS